MLGCPDCPTTLETRALVFDERFLFQLALIVLPFVVVAILVGFAVRQFDER